MKKSLAAVCVGIPLLTAVISAGAQTVSLRNHIGQLKHKLAEACAGKNTEAIRTQLILLGSLYRILRGKQ